MKVALLDCWSDLNRGDLGIILATIDLLKKKNNNIEIIGVSCFSENDKDFFTNHEILKQHINQIYSAIFGILTLKIRKKNNYNKFSKIFLFFGEVIRFLLILLFPPKIAFYLFKKSEKITLTELCSCDFAISKGGSIFTCEKTMRDRCALLRSTFLYLILKKYKIKYYILGQSLGPINSKFNLKIVNNILKNAEKVFVREKLCLEAYKEIHIPKEKLFFSNDIAFSLESKEMLFPLIDEKNFNVGFTVRPNFDNKEIYIKEILNSICYLIEKYNANIYIFPQVVLRTDPDRKMALQIYDSLEDKYKKNIVILTDDYTPKELKYLYGKMKFFVGTRLHSMIFAMGESVPCIGLIYHGTKTQGIFFNMGVNDLLIKKLSKGILVNKIKNLLDNYEEIKKTINKNLKKAKKQNYSSIETILSDYEGVN